MLWSRIPCRIGLVLGFGVAGALPAAGQQAAPPHARVAIGGASMPEPAVGRIVLHAPWRPEGLLATPGHTSEPSRGGPRLSPVVHPVAPAPLDRRDDVSGAAAEGRHTVVFSTLGLILVVAIVTILLVK